MGNESSQFTPPQNNGEFYIQLKDASKLDDLCKSLTSRGTPPNAIYEGPNSVYLWVPITEETTTDLNKGRMVDCDVIPCAYNSKGRKYALTKTSEVNIKELEERLRKGGQHISAWEYGPNSTERRTVYVK
jgi:hypothetical protein